MNAERERSSSQLDSLANVVLHLECGICLQIFNDPRNLPCGHTFCRTCITNYRTSEATRNQADLCPICRLQYVLPAGGVDSLPRNYCVGSMISNTVNRPRICVMAGVDEGRTHEGTSWFCPQCIDILCDNCSRAHVWNKFTYPHILKKTEDVTPAEWRRYDLVSFRKCRTHPQDIVTLFCKQCQHVMCPKCVSEDVHGHVYLKLEDAETGFETSAYYAQLSAGPISLGSTSSWSGSIDSLASSRSKMDELLVMRGPFGGNGGGPFSDAGHELHGPITAMRIRYWARVDAIQFCYGTVWAPKYGGNGGKEKEVKFESGEVIVKVKVSWDKTVHNVTFVTNKRAHGPFGSDNGTKHKIETGGNRLRYISGRSGREIDQLTFHFD